MQNGATKPRRPAYAREVIAAKALGEALNLTCFVGRTAWDRARVHHGGTRGHRLVVQVDHECAVEDYDFEFLVGEEIVVDSLGFDLPLSIRIARRMCAHGVRMAVLLHPALEQPQFFYGEWR